MNYLPAALLLAFAAQATYSFSAGPPQPDDANGGYFVPMTFSAYRAEVAGLQSMRSFIPIRRLPPHLSPDARFGFNVVVDNQNRSWILEGSNARGWTLYLDLHGDGNLAAARPLQFKKAHGIYRLRVMVARKGDSYPCEFTIVEHHFTRANTYQRALWISEGTVRHGEIVLGNRRAAFNLYGSSGRYDIGQSVVIGSSEGLQRYSLDERHLNLFGRSFTFRVAPAGEALSLTPLPYTLADRPSLKPGTAAPAFSARGIDGRVVALSQYHGGRVLLDFWSTYCEPCQKEMSQMAKRYKQVQQRGLSVIGVSADDSQNLVRAFTSRNGASWPQIVEGPSGSIQRLYRVTALPAHYLIGRDGRILTSWTGGDQTAAMLSKFLK